MNEKIVFKWNQGYILKVIGNILTKWYTSVYSFLENKHTFSFHPSLRLLGTLQFAYELQGNM